MRRGSSSNSCGILISKWIIDEDQGVKGKFMIVMVEGMGSKISSTGLIYPKSS